MFGHGGAEGWVASIATGDGFSAQGRLSRNEIESHGWARYSQRPGPRIKKFFCFFLFTKRSPSLLEKWSRHGRWL
jgi:hypothetical protein